ncbi:MAG: hypothetical protein ACW98Y_17110 [Candidatus Thorarchaeota archaeon]|jgi:hypothetical protein
MAPRTLTLAITFLLIATIAVSTTHVSAQDTLTFSLSRDFGTGLGSSIEGTFSIHGSGPEVIIGLIVYFNGVEVHQVSGNTIDWQFNTADYPAGETNITLYGWDDQGETYVASQHVTILSSTVGTAITIGIIALVVVLIVFRYVPRFLGSGKKGLKT